MTFQLKLKNIRLCEVWDQVQDKISNQMFKNDLTQEFLSENKSEQITNKICLFILF
jgi:hypothetical protein